MEKHFFCLEFVEKHARKILFNFIKFFIAVSHVPKINKQARYENYELLCQNCCRPLIEF